MLFLTDEPKSHGSWEANEISFPRDISPEEIVSSPSITCEKMKIFQQFFAELLLHKPP